MKQKVVLMLGLLLLVFAAACGAAATPSAISHEPLPPQPPASNSTGGGAASDQAKSLPGAVPAQAPDPNANPAGAAAATDRLIIRTANLSLTVKDAEAALETIKGTAAALGGFVSNSQLTRINKDQVRVTVTVRVAADKFDEALKQIKAAGLRVNSEQIGGQDVTEEYTDLGARLRNLEATERELLSLMTTVREKTGSAQDILAVERELNTVRGQIEQLKGRMQYLDNSVSLATLTLDLVPDTLDAPVASDVWDPLRVARDATRSLVVAVQGLINVAIYLVIFLLPVILIVGLPIALLLRWLRRPRRQRPATVA
jgi:Domain of unknown function (DUF4349)